MHSCYAEGFKTLTPSPSPKATVYTQVVSEAKSNQGK